MRHDSLRNRERILEAALDLLSADPHAGLAAIATHAGVGRVTLYAHFDSRSALIAEVFDLHLARVRDALVQHAGTAPDSSPADQVRELVAGSWSAMAAVDGLIAAAEAELGLDRTQAAHTEILGLIASLIAEGIACGDFRTTQNPEWLARIFFVLLHGMTGRSSEADDGELVEQLTTSYLALLVAGD